MTIGRSTPTGTSRHTPAVVAAHAFVFAALTWWSWRKWPDPLVDFGRELYVPWQITRGQLLYGDIASLFGPLSSYVNAFWFRLFGVSFTTLVACNLAILAATTAGIYHLIRVATDEVAAPAATLTVLALCGFSQYLDVGNYNFISPYSHETTHGFALSVAAFVSLWRAMRLERRGERLWLFGLAGVCAGAVLLTKPETAIAAIAAVTVACAATRFLGRDDRVGGWDLAALSSGAMLPPLGFILYFHRSVSLHQSTRMSWREAGRAVATGWTTAFGTAIARNPFYRFEMGLDHPLEHTLRMLAAMLGLIAFVCVAVAIAWRRPSRPLARALVAGLQLLLGVGGGLAVPRYEVLSALPLVAIAGFAVSTYLFARRRHDRSRAMAMLPLTMWSVFAVVLLTKMWLNARIYHYGFYLALPAVSLTVVLLLWLVPVAIRPWAPAGAPERARFVLATAIAATVASHLALSAIWYGDKVTPVGTGGDRFLASKGPAFWQGDAVQQAVERIQRRTPPGSTLTVIPEGVMINYLSRRETPVPFVNFMPPELIAFGEGAIVQSLDAHPPDYLMLVHRTTAEYGYALFGASADYGQEVMAWVRSRYVRTDLIGRDPMSASGFGIEILERAR
ncbi:MAG TPA: glycosyltransferase family 39 protein [Vicinamibacterales bacterium]|nr:glycosyltransferase family 39 protein [Vicinamibacterales bacterium]